MIRLNPTVLDKAKELTGARSDDQLGQAFLNLTGATIRAYRSGRSIPNIITIARLKQLTGIPLDQMVIEDSAELAA
ncbi:hypothetical protein [Corynebacterium ulcerans]|uniref:HTH cro/C1-type domain-containing protein n=1 Tax=Corynebacterium ulcerans FRC58 TaxID=1408268 RepID=A0ABM5U266_CORUL|nr:hypothetical protein [Corynebacterium ulcerans]AKN77563.1 Hypothetical protein CulFRC58_1709 [Corynebacterium ulcerans FRC58]NOL62837.1 hypothetical protein [Corynebacterium ulcerans]NON15644.1 hypothetical protein [Corynebacterium ulcerans]PLW02082.1 hypothetical protein BRL54_08875 [Corynebacterium ulcerans]